MRVLFTGAIMLLMLWHCWWKPRQSRKKIGNRYTKAKTPVKLVIFFAVLLTVVGGSEARWQYLQLTASSALKEVTGNPNASLKCQRISALLIDMDSASMGGKVYRDDVNTAILKYDECADLFMWMQSINKESPSQKQVWAIHVLTHEGVHTTGEFNEAVTECTAIQRDARMVEALGGSSETGLLLQKNYYENIYPRMSSSYRMSDCIIDQKYDSLLTSGDTAER